MSNGKSNLFHNLYIHIPFCLSKCGYCAFYSIPGAGKEQRRAYLEKLRCDFEYVSDSCGELQSLYIGGGTPTLLSCEELEFLFESINNNFRFALNAEISIECNPETLDDSKAEILGTFTNRVSLGIQSFKPLLRDALQRQGDVGNLFETLAALRKKGIYNLGADLIYAIPGQSLDDWREDLEAATALGVMHISAYALTIEEGARLARQGGMEPFEDSLSADMWGLTENVLREKGFSRYEISNYSLNGVECRHNMNVWRGQKYLGLGPAASSFDGRKRWTQAADLTSWLKNIPPEIDSLDSSRRAREIFAIGLRTSSGWNFGDLEHFLVQEDLEKLKNECEKFVDEGMMLLSASSVKLSAKGLLLWDSIAEFFI
jgi:oxygen-independent coproporphyrinogen-3 oxidase